METSSFRHTNEKTSVHEYRFAMERLMLQRHQTAMAACYFDESLQSLDSLASFDEPELQQRLADLPPERQEVFREIFCAFKTLLSEALQTEEVIRTSFDVMRRDHFQKEQAWARRERERLADSIEEALAHGADTLPTLRRGKKSQHVERRNHSLEDLATFFFHQRTGHFPLGKITFFREGPYFILECAEESDYQRAYLGRMGVDVERARRSGGSFHYAINIGLPTPAKGRWPRASFPLILLNGMGSDARLRGTVRHERRHFINHRLLGLDKTNRYPFSRVEAPSSRRSDSSIQANIKDEVLAFIDEGQGNISQSLELPIYNHLFDVSDPEAQKRYAQVLREIDAALQDNILWQLQTEKARTILVYHLADIRLTSLPRWLRIVDTFYRSHPESFSEI